MAMAALRPVWVLSGLTFISGVGLGGIGTLILIIVLDGGLRNEAVSSFGLEANPVLGYVDSSFC